MVLVGSKFVCVCVFVVVFSCCRSVSPTPLDSPLTLTPRWVSAVCFRRLNYSECFALFLRVFGFVLFPSGGSLAPQDGALYLLRYSNYDDFPSSPRSGYRKWIAFDQCNIFCACVRAWGHYLRRSVVSIRVRFLPGPPLRVHLGRARMFKYAYDIEGRSWIITSIPR